MTKNLKSTSFLLQNKDVVDRSVEFYKDLQAVNPNAIENLVSRLKQGERVPFPCSPDQNEPCSIPISFPVYNPYLTGIADDFKVCGSGRYYIFFSRRTSTPPQPFTIWSFYVTNILKDAAGNVYAIEGAFSDGEPSSKNYINHIMGEGPGQWALKALQC
ncbi:hypothetical protein KFF76_15165 [Bacillus subtilis]|uniref:hypothetical protein n=1 Tax=Bacillus subtilis TaxID=1423 RepID=UPI001BA694AB|nr:hypothetical protein [Bacillus subtilis]QWF73574.1 hypothetical protein KFF76_15165 [Bacillus subtilis]